MDNNRYVPREIEIDLVELMWRMLSQWKAILVVAVIFAILVPAAVYMKDARAYESAMTVAEENAAKVTNLDQATEEILDELLPEERPAVEQALVNDKILESKQDYLLNSLLVNLNTEDASSLSKGYVFSDIDDWTMQNALISGYSTAFRGDKALKEIMKAMNVDSQLRYIQELVTVEGYADTDMAGYVKLTITCPDKNAEGDVSEAVDKIMHRTKKDLAKTVTGHDLKKIYSQSAFATPDIPATAKQTTYSDLYNTQSQQRAHIATFTAEQTAAYEEITALQFAAKEDAQSSENTTKAGTTVSADLEDEIPPPDFSKKFTVVGFLLGIIFYVGLYVVWMILIRRIDNAGAAETYTGVRLLGSYYCPAKRNKLLAFLLSSKAVIKHQHGKEMDLTVQADRIADEINASCENKHIQKITLLQMFEGGGAADLLSAVADRLQTPSQIVKAWPSAGPKDLANREDAVLFLDTKTKMATVDSTLSLCADYGIRKTGTVFVGEV